MTDQSEDALVSNTVSQGNGDARDSWDQALAAAFGGGEAPVAAGESILAALSEYFGKLPRVSLRPPAGGQLVNLPASDPAGSLPQGLGRFHLYGEIGRGGMGAIYLGRDSDLGRDLAVKVLLESHQHKPELGRRFLYEAQVAGQLEHPAIPPVYELGRLADGRPFFAMKLVRGKTFAALLNERKSPADDLPRHLDILTQVCQAMAYAHSRGVIHRDLKPSNIMVGAFGEVQLMDWGLAKVLPPGGVTAESLHTAGDATVTCTPDEARHDTDRFDDSNTRAGSVVGTPAYMSPEQARGNVEALDERSDVFSLGAILCEILTGKPPYTGANVTAIRDLAAQGDQTLARERLSECPSDKELATLAETCLAPAPPDRPRNAAELAERLSSYHQSVEKRLHDAELATAAAQAKAVEERRRRRVSLALTFVLIAVTAFAVGGGTWWYQQRQQMVRDVESALNEAATHGKAGRWDDVRAALQRTRGQLGSGGPAVLRSRVAQAEKDAQMVAELRRISRGQSEVRAGGFQFADANEPYRAAFLAYGIEVNADALGQSTAAIRRSAIGDELLLGIDNWAITATLWKSTLCRDLLSLANASDDDVWRRKFRDALIHHDDQALRRSVAEDAAKKQPPDMLYLVALRLRQVLGPKGTVDFLREAQQRHPEHFWLNHSMGLALFNQQPSLAQDAIGYYRAAAAIRPESPGSFLNLGIALRQENKLSDSIAAFERAVLLKPDYAGAHFELGVAWRTSGNTSKAIESFRRSIAANPNDWSSCFALANELKGLGQSQEAIDYYQKAIDTGSDRPEAYNNMGTTLAELGKNSEAIECFRSALRLRPNHVSAHINLGEVLQLQGDFVGALAAYEKGHELGSQSPDWKYPSQQWIDTARRLVELDARLAGVLANDQSPLSGAELAEFADLCKRKKQFGDSVKLYSIALEKQAPLGEDLLARWRHDAARSAAMSAAGEGNNAKVLTGDERKELRQKCLAWLKHDLAARKKAATEGDEKIKQAMAAHLAHALKDSDLASVRDAAALEKLPEEERTHWRALWDETDSVRKGLAPKP